MEIVSVTESEIKVKFNFTNPLEVSPEDQVNIKLGFGAFDAGMAEDLNINIPATRQVLQNSATSTIVALSQASQAASTTAVVGSALL